MKNKKQFGIVACVLLLLLGLGIAFGVGRQADGDTPSSPEQSDYRDLVEQYAEQYGIPSSLVFAVIQVESNFDANARSSAGAVGLMQMMPKTFEWLTGDSHLREHLPASALLQPEVSIRYGTYYLHYLYQRFGQNWRTALAAYNGGEGNVTKWLQDPACSDGQGNLTYIPFEETRHYVEKVMRAEQAYLENDRTP